MIRSIQRFLATVAVFSASFSSVQALPAGANIQLWFKADAGVTTNGSGNVSTWADQSGNGNNATNLTLANQPLWIDNVLNGKPVVRFDGVNDELSSLGDVNLTNAYSIFIITKNAVRKDYNGVFRLDPIPFEARSNLEIYWQSGTSNSGNSVYAANRRGDGSTLSGVFTTSNAKPPVNNYYLLDVVASGAGATQRIQGITIASGAGGGFLPTNSALAHLGIGYGGSGVAGVLNGDIAEVIVYNTTLSTADRIFVSGYLADKYGLTIPEPGTIGLSAGGLAILLRILRHRRNT